MRKRGLSGAWRKEVSPLELFGKRRGWPPTRWLLKATKGKSRLQSPVPNNFRNCRNPRCPRGCGCCSCRGCGCDCYCGFGFDCCTRCHS